jgi:hypothetical protein
MDDYQNGVQRVRKAHCRGMCIQRHRGYRVRRVWRYQRGNQNPYIEEEDNAMAKRKSTKGKTMIYKTLHIKLRHVSLTSNLKKSTTDSHNAAT